ncbi:MAG: hypothetical protein IPJ00_11960 [Saprospirales bacterium]|nr:hypothetical protein [Saprospirales bacterium]
MNTHTQNFKVRLGLFVIIGLAIFVFAIFIIGKQKHLFDPVFKVTSTFYNISGLQVGNNVRFRHQCGYRGQHRDHQRFDRPGRFAHQAKCEKFIRQDCGVAIGSEGLIGDRLVIVTQGSGDSPMVKNGQELESVEPIETDAIMASLRVTAGYAEVVTEQLAEIMVKINSGSGTLGRLIQDTTIAQNLDQTMLNLKRSSKGLDETCRQLKTTFC